MGKYAAHVRPRKRRKWLVIPIVLVILAAVLFTLSNIPSVAASLAQTPILGKLVSVLQISGGNGGEPTDGIGAVAEPTDDGSVRISFEAADASADSAPVYLIREGAAPRRLELTFYGVRNLDFDALSESLSKLSYVKDVYRTTILDDSTAALTIELDQEVTWEASEYQDPGYIDLKLAPKSSTSDSSAFIIRSASAPMGEPLASLAESLGEYNPSIVKTQQGDFCVSVGPYATQEEAQSVLDMLNNDTFTIESVTLGANPK